MRFGVGLGRMFAASACLTALPVACRGGVAPAPEAAGASQGGAGTESALIGRVAIVGSTPMEQVVIRREAGGSVEVRGPLREELRHLSGARVEARGHPEARGFTVTGYDILEIAGGTPAVGWVRLIDGGVALETGWGELRLYDPPAELRRAGAKVWVNVGPRGDVRAYGVIREP